MRHLCAIAQICFVVANAPHESGGVRSTRVRPGFDYDDLMEGANLKDARLEFFDLFGWALGASPECRERNESGYVR